MQFTTAPTQAPQESAECVTEKTQYTAALLAVLLCAANNTANTGNGTMDPNNVEQIAVVCTECTAELMNLTAASRAGVPSCAATSQVAFSKESARFSNLFRLLCLRDAAGELCLPKLQSLGEFQEMPEQALGVLCDGGCFAQFRTILAEQLDCQPSNVLLGSLCERNSAGQFCAVQIQNKFAALDGANRMTTDRAGMVDSELAAAAVENFCGAECGFRYVTSFRAAFDKQSRECPDTDSLDELDEDDTSEDRRNARILNHICSNDGQDFCVSKILRNQERFGNAFPECSDPTSAEAVCSPQCSTMVREFSANFGCCARVYPYLTLGNESDAGINYAETMCSVPFPNVCADLFAFSAASTVAPTLFMTIASTILMFNH